MLIIRRIRSAVRSFFGFSKVEANGFLILLPLMILSILSVPVYRFWFYKPGPPDFAVEAARLDSIRARWDAEDSVQRRAARQGEDISLFDFDPNQATQDQLEHLGIAPGVALRLIHYRERGGRFRVKADLLKVYGLDSAVYQRLRPHILLPENLNVHRADARAYAATPGRADEKSQRFDLNEADTTELKAIRGIGPVLSSRIIKYRRLLGGFVKHNQLYEVYGLDSSVVRKIAEGSFISASFQPRRLNINYASARALAHHPYITTDVAQAIVVYRFQHGAFGAVDELAGIERLNNRDFEKMKPYLTTGEP